jgi:hypothetical protein
LRSGSVSGRQLPRQRVGERLVGALRQHVGLQHLAHELVTDQLDLRTEHLVAVRVIPVVVGVDDIPHRLRGDRADVVDQRARRGRRHVRIDHHHVVGVDDDQ